MHVKKLSKDDYELLAKLILTHYVSDTFNQLELKDRPDLQSDNLSIGIEVTRGISQQQGHVQSILIEGINNDGLTRDEIETLTGYGRVLKGRKTSDDKIHIVISPIYADLEKSIKDIEIAVKYKIEKFEEYDEFSKKGIFVYSESPIIREEEIYLIFDSFDKRNYPLEYLFVFVHGDDRTLYFKNFIHDKYYKIEDSGEYDKVIHDYNLIKSNI